MTLNQGYYVQRKLLRPSEVDLLKRAYDEVQEKKLNPSSQILYTHRLPATPRPHFSNIADQWFNLFRRDLEHSMLKLYGRVETLLESIGLYDYSLFQDSFIQKVNTQTPFHWHQDFPFWPVDRPDGWTVWIAMDPVNDFNGGIEIAVGSHHLEAEPVVDLHTGEPQLADEKPVFIPEEFERIRLNLESGDALLFHALTYHFSKPNTTQDSRRAWASVWLGPEVRWQKSRAPRHFICKLVNDGELVHGFWR